MGDKPDKTDKTEGILRGLAADFDSERYPPEFSETYEALECLSHGGACETLLVKRRGTDAYCVAKCYMKNAPLSHVTEGELLSGFDHPGLPRYEGEYRNERMLCVVREYIEGDPLDRYAAQNPISKQQALALGEQLSDILIYLHGRIPPVIHRDIKPQNTIVDRQGSLRLIDFGISRLYAKDARRDTVCLGTMHFAPPEQYGFSQTDCRADIFSFGVWLGWLLTGETEIARILPKIDDRNLRRIVRKCTAFAPLARYASARKLKAALLRASGRGPKRALRRAAAFFACLICLSAGFLLGRYTAEIAPAYAPARGVRFEEPLVEQAVRAMLGKTEGEPISEDDLLSVTELYIYGDQAAANARAFGELDDRMAANDGTLKNGGIRSLADMTKFPNLKVLRAALENVSDLSPLSGLERLEELDLRHNPVADVSPLAALTFLREVCLFNTRVTDLSALSACPLLERIDAGKTGIASPAAFEGIAGLKSLTIRQIPLKTLFGIEAFGNLEQIALSHVADGDLTPLAALPRLQTAHLDESLREEAERDLKEAAFRIVYP